MFFLQLSKLCGSWYRSGLPPGKMQGGPRPDAVAYRLILRIQGTANLRILKHPVAGRGSSVGDCDFYRLQGRLVLAWFKIVLQNPPLEILNGFTRRKSHRMNIT